MDDVVDMIGECSLLSRVPGPLELLRAGRPGHPVGVTVVAPHSSVLLTREREIIGLNISDGGLPCLVITVS